MMNLEKYFKKNENAFYFNSKDEKKFRGVCKYYGDTVRNDEAGKQSKLPPTPISTVFSYVNEFVELVRASNGYCTKNVRYDTIVLDNSIHSIIDNGIIANELKWRSPRYDKEIRDYVEWDSKYDVISSFFHTEKPKNLIWLKFTQKGHVGVIAKSFDINFDSKDDDGKPISSDVLVKEVGDSWNTSFVMIFPMTSDILGNRSVGDLELGIGNYLTLEKHVPVIDYYSHNN